MMAAMQPDSLDILEKAKIPPEQARAFVSAMKVEIGRATETLATKHDVELVRHEMAEMRQALEFKIEAVRGELRAEIHATASSITRQMYAAIFAQLAVLLGIVYALTHTGR
jgi:polyhydroxyalkanoate synthesis regulator phasin